jgi:hypothetical protein
MKPISSLLTLMLVLVFASCKKEKEPDASLGNTANISGKTFWGTFTNAGETSQYYSVHFNEDKTLLWNQFSGDYPGTWAVSNNKLTMTFTSPAVIVNADILDGIKLLNITTNTANKVNSGELTDTPDMSVENTKWAGVIAAAVGPFETTFLSGLGLKVRIGTTTYLGSGYFRSPSGGAIRFLLPTTTTTMFCVIASHDKMYGTYGTYKYTWQTTKQ